ncbi:hypothetical protein LTR15_011827 [Elasticomyces elasticus]|nr:hypothetical protein LTR15_011827 [Elasticomyces elasticus]
MPSSRTRVRIKRSSSDGSSSGIDVAAARPTENHNPSSDIHVAGPSVNGVTDGDGDGARCRVDDGHMLVIRLRPDQVALLNTEASNSNGLDAGHTVDDNDHVGGGRNHRGTFSKKHVQRHPEIEWVHRGQGRYLPAEQVRRESTAAAVGAPERKSRSHRTIQEEFDHQVQIKREDLETDTLQPPPTGTTFKSLRSTSADDATHKLAAISPPAITPAPAPRKRAPRDSLTDALSGPPQYGLRRHHRDSLSQPQSPAIATASESRSGRFARRSDAKFLPSIEKSLSLSLTLPLRRTSLRKSFTAARTAESDEDESEVEVDEDSEVEGSEMSRGRKDTYDREYVDAHPGEVFHHAGNGWFRRGPRPSGKTKGKGKAVKREVVVADEVPAVVKEKKREKKRQVSYGLDSNASIHKEDLGNYPGQVFTHKGNGWYRPGPDPSGQRRSIVIASGGDDSENEVDEEEESADEDEEEVSEDDDAPAGTVGRKYKDAHPETEWVHRGNGRYVRKSKLSAPPVSAEPPAETQRRGSERTYSKKFVIEHPGEEFYHTGNARHKRGSRPSVVKSAPPESVVDDDNDNAESEDEAGGGLVDKAFVTAHPHLQFHHRGQGRYARGPRLATTPARNEGSEDEDDGEGDVDGVSRDSLVDGAFVNAHPGITFYHRGQGRWAFGMPPSYSHNKVAVRGPGAREWKVSVGEEEGDEGPSRTALFMKAEGPEKFPEFLWHYRGGGKWGRMTKMEVDLAASVGGGKGRRGVQRRGGGDGGGEERPKIRRSRKGLNGVGDEGEGPNKVREKVPKPKPRMLEPEEDVLEDDDLPSIFGEEWPALTGTEDAIDKQTRKVFKPLNTNEILASLAKFDPAARSTGNLLEIAANAQRALLALQEEYLALDRVTAQHAKIPRRPAKGGTVPVDPQVFEDRKEADLYDYAFDPRRIGFQDPEAQHIVRDAEGRELRQRRNRTGVGATDTVPGWKFGEEGLDGKRQSRQPNRFDANIEMQQPARKRMRAMGGASPLSMTPDRAATPLGGGGVGNNTNLLGLGRLGNVPKRIQQLRGESVGSVRSEGGSPAKHKGRPPGSKNLHKRSDAGIPKGPRKKKVVEVGEVGEESEVKGVEAAVDRDFEM